MAKLNEVKAERVTTEVTVHALQPACTKRRRINGKTKPADVSASSRIQASTCGWFRKQGRVNMCVEILYITVMVTLLCNWKLAT